jgi:hypothetical protein
VFILPFMMKLPVYTTLPARQSKYGSLSQIVMNAMPATQSKQSARLDSEAMQALAGADSREHETTRGQPWTLELWPDLKTGLRRPGHLVLTRRCDRTHTVFAVEAGIAGSVLYSTTQPSRGVPLPDSGDKMISRMSTHMT